jgi:hypothetical protein
VKSLSIATNLKSFFFLDQIFPCTSTVQGHGLLFIVVKQNLQWLQKTLIRVRPAPLLNIDCIYTMKGL